MLTNVADPDPGSGIRCLFDPWIRDLGSGIGFFRIPDLGSRIPNPYFWELIDNFLGKKFYNSLKIGPNFFSSTFPKNSSILWNLWLQKKVWQQIFFRPSLLLLFLDPGSETRDPGSGINIPDPQHCNQVCKTWPN